MVIAFIVVVSLILCVWATYHYMVGTAYDRDPFLVADPDAPVPDDAPLVSVMIPARNEGDYVGGTLKSLLSQSYTNIEVFVINDRSEDDTEKIVRGYAEKDPRLHLLQHDELPEEWTGKNHALWSASAKARGEIFFFLDADIHLDPGALAVMVNHFTEQKLDMLSMGLRSGSKSFWDHAICLIAGPAIMLRFPVVEVNDPNSPTAFANGQDLMIRANVYRDIDGHRSVKSILLEDVALAQVLKEKGYKLCFAFGFDMAKTHWYPSLKKTFQGWSRIFYSSLQGSIPGLLALLLLLAVFMLGSTGILIYAVCRVLDGDTSKATATLIVLSVGQILMMKALALRLCLMTRCKFRYVVAYLPATCLTVGICLSAIHKRFSSRGIVWRGTTYLTHRIIERRRNGKADG